MKFTSTRVATALRSPWTLAVMSAAAAGAALFVQQKARRAEHDNPPLGDFVEVDGTRVHYVERGEGAVVVLLHGNAVSLQDFIASGVFATLGDQYRVVALDCPGFGHSERDRRHLWTAERQAAVVAGALALLGVQRCTIVAHSWSTLIALSLALDHPERVQGLVLLSGYYYPSVRLDVPMVAVPAIPVLGDLLRYTVSGIAARLMLKPAVKAMFSPADVPTQYLKTVPREMMLRPSQMRASAEDAALMIPAARALSPRYGELSMPVTVIAGRDDKVVRLQGQSKRFHEAVAHSRLDVVPQAGHMVHHAVPEQVVAAVHAMQTPTIDSPVASRSQLAAA